MALGTDLVIYDHKASDFVGENEMILPDSVAEEQSNERPTSSRTVESVNSEDEDDQEDENLSDMDWD